MSGNKKGTATREVGPGAVEVGLGAVEALAVPGAGVVLSRHHEGAWLRLPGGICGLASPAAVPGPLWVRNRFPWDRLPPGTPVRVTTAGVEVGGLSLPLAGTDVVLWQGALPPPHLIEAVPARRLAIEALAGALPPALLDEALAAAARRGAAAVAGGDLGAAAEALGGLGPGLTPAGDDVLAGLLLAARARQGPESEPRLLAVAASVPTTDLAAAFLRWAARGQHIAPAHELLDAAARGDRPHAVAVVTRLVRFGASSGTALALGLRLGLAAPPAPVPGLHPAPPGTRPTPPMASTPAPPGTRPARKQGFCRFLSDWAGMSDLAANSSSDTSADRPLGRTEQAPEGREGWGERACPGPPPF